MTIHRFLFTLAPDIVPEEKGHLNWFNNIISILVQRVCLHGVVESTEFHYYFIRFCKFTSSRKMSMRNGDRMLSRI